MRFIPIGSEFAAEVEGIDLCAPFDAAAGNGFARNEAWATVARPLIWITALTWLSLSLFYGSIVFGSAPPTGSIVVGWTNRILITTFILWLLVAAFHTRSRCR